MDKISWLLYLADVSQSIAVVALIIFIIMIIAWFVFLVIGSDVGYDSAEERLEKKNSYSKFIKWAIPVNSFCLLLIIFMPSRAVIYAYAATNITKELAATEKGQQVSRIIDLYLDKVVKELADSNKPTKKE